MKKVKAFICCFAMLCVISAPVSSYAAEFGEAQTTDIEYLGDGITVETTITVHSSLLRSSTKSATRASTYKDNGTTIATVTLNATFGYDGSSAWVVSASASHWVASNWTYENQSISTTGATARVTATLKKWLGSTSTGTASVNSALTCSAGGTVS
ncbi:MAG: hypothetical protein LBK75_07735 [Oscillospiraceae bacterium]|jgi:hypothetical protein|nr:hypothetical protein [Oscillospiraceae bacterium]